MFPAFQFDPVHSRPPGRAFLTALCLLMATSAVAHDMWLLPDEFTVSKGEELTVRQLLGEELTSDVLLGKGAQEIDLLRRITARFEITTPAGTVDLLADLPPEKSQPVIRPVLDYMLDFDGLAMVAMDHSFIYIEHSNDVFRHYLEHEGLEVGRMESHLGDRATQSERYARFFKTLIQSGDRRTGTLYERTVGQDLEIVLGNNPYVLNPGDMLDVQILFKGSPLGDAQVSAYNSDGSTTLRTLTAHTDANGNAQFELVRPGTWLIRLVHLLPCVDGDRVRRCKSSDWESYWATFTFELD